MIAVFIILFCVFLRMQSVFLKGFTDKQQKPYSMPKGTKFERGKYIMRKGFDENGFMSYLEATFDGFDNSFLRDLVRNVIDYAQKREHVSKDQFAYFVSDMLPEVEFGEVAMFCEDSILTEEGQRMKREAIINYSVA